MRALVWASVRSLLALLILATACGREQTSDPEPIGEQASRVSPALLWQSGATSSSIEISWDYDGVYDPAMGMYVWVDGSPTPVTVCDVGSSGPIGGCRSGKATLPTAFASCSTHTIVADPCWYDAGSCSRAYEVATITASTIGASTATAPAALAATPTDFPSANRWIYTGTSAVQSVPQPPNPNVFADASLAVVRGTVKTRAGDPVVCGRVNVVGHPEYGGATTLWDGSFALAVNGTSPLLVDIQGAVSATLLPVQRRVVPRVHDYVWIDEARLTPYSGSGTQINSTNRFVMGPSEPPSSTPTRRLAAFFPTGTAATVQGVSEPLTTFSVRPVEYTVGAGGPAAMPGLLPPASGYTFAASFELAGYERKPVTFDRSVFLYVDNWASVPNGTQVPNGTYNETLGLWVPEANGKVVKIKDCSGGRANVATGSDITNADNSGISDDERVQLALMYPEACGGTDAGAGTGSVWRLEVNHFSSFDWNFALRAAVGAVVPGLINLLTGDTTAPSCRAGSIIECENQTLGEVLPVAGSPFSLVYSSARQPGRWREINASVEKPSGATIKRVEAQATIAGQQLPASAVFEATSGGKTYYQVGFRWDGRDLAGRVLNGRHRAHVKIGFVYPADYFTVTSFGDPAAMSTSSSGISFSADESRKEATLYREAEVWVDTWSDAIQGLGGWSLSPVHYFDAESNTLYRGDGSLIHASPADASVETVAGGGTSEPTSGALARSVWLPYELTAFTVGPDRSVYYGTAESVLSRDGVWKIQPDPASAGDGFATARVYRIVDKKTHGIAVDASGRIFYSSEADNRVYRFDPATSSTVSVAGTTGGPGAGADGPASTSALNNPRDLSLVADGTLYLVDDGNHRVRRIVFGPTPTIQTVAGGGTATTSGSKARDLYLPFINAIAARSNGDLFIATEDKIWRIAPDGYAYVVAGGGSAPPNGGESATSVSLTAIRRMAIAPDGTLFFTYGSYPTNCRVYQLEGDSVVRVVAGAGACATEIKDGGRAVESKLDEPTPIAIDSRGDLFVGNKGQNFTGQEGTHRVVRIATGLRTMLVGSERHVPSSDGREVYVFNTKGVIQRTIDAFTGRTILRFDHAVLDSTKLTRIEDAFGNALDINRISSTSIELVSSPDGLKSKLTLAAGYLKQFEDAENRPSTFVYDTGGLMREYKDVIASATTSGSPYQFAYDGDGRLYSDAHPISPSAAQTLWKSTSPRGWNVDVHSAGGRLVSYGIETDDQGNRVKKQTVTTAVDTTIEDVAGRFVERTSASGATFTSQFQPDPRFGQLASFVKQFDFKASPTRTAATTTLARTVVPATATGAGNATSVTDTYSWNDGVARTLAVTTEKITTTGGSRVRAQLPSNAIIDFEYEPRGSTTTVATDRLVKIVTAGVDDLRVAYDARGRVTAMQQGSTCPAFSDPHPPTDCVTGPTAVPAGCRRISVGYHATNGNLACAFDGLGLLVRQTPDKLGRATSVTLPYGPSGSSPSYRIVSLNYTNSGTTQASVPISVSGSTSAVHTFSIDRPTRKFSYEAPPISTGPTITSLTVGVDHEVTAATPVEPWANVSVTYLSNVVRPFYTQFGGGMTGADYFGDYFEFYPDGRPWLASRLRNHFYEWETYKTLGYDGVLPTNTRSVYYAGTFTLDSTVTRTFDSRLRVATEQLTPGTAPTATYTYGPDGSINTVSAGGSTLTIARLLSGGAPRADGAVSATTLGTTTESLARSAFGEVLGDRDGSENAITWGADYNLSGTRLLGSTYSRDARGRITKLTETIAAAGTMPTHTRTTNYTYRRDGALERVIVRDGLNGNVGTVVRDVTYNYDVNGNIDLAGTYDTQDRLVSMYSGYGFANHDRDGRMTQKNYDFYYWHDAHDQLTDVARYDWGAYIWKYARYRLDAYGRRTTRTVDGVSGVTSYVYEDGALLPIAEFQNSTLIWRFVYGSKPNVPDFAVKDGTVYRIFSDHLGSPRLVVNTTSGAIVQRMDYDEWGNVTEWVQSGLSPIPFGFAGGLYDRLTGLVHFGARDYDPVLHRWITKDPADFDGGGTNFYAYANNDPVNLIDPEGTIPIAPLVAGFVWGFGGDVAWQLLANGGNFRCVDIKSAVIAGGFGAAGGVLSMLGTGVRGFEWSHFIPNRTKNLRPDSKLLRRIVDSRLNGNYVPAGYHMATDPSRWQFVPRILKPQTPQYLPGLAQALRMPGWFAGGAAGMAAAGPGSAGNCGCQ